MAKRPRWWRALAGAATLALLCVTAAHADVSPGEKITDQNIDKVKDLISPGMEWVLKHGWPMTIGETKRIEWPKAYREATEKYSGQVKLTPDGLNVLNYVAGLPFPNIDPKDPQIALKIMWNWGYTYLTTDDVDLRNFDADTGAIADHGPLTVERHFLLDHFRLSRAAGALSHPRAVRSEGRRRARQPLHLIREAGRLVALPAVAPPRAPALDRAALRRAVRAGHRRRQLLRLQRPRRLDGLQVPR
jgi:hypothetical protein